MAACSGVSYVDSLHIGASEYRDVLTTLLKSFIQIEGVIKRTLSTDNDLQISVAYTVCQKYIFCWYVIVY
jgi:hypothetical protein